MELQALERESTLSILPPKSHTPLFNRAGDKSKQFNQYQEQQKYGALVGGLLPPQTTSNFYNKRGNHVRGVSSSVIVSSSGDKMNIANPQTPLFKGFTRKSYLGEQSGEDDIYLNKTGSSVTTTRMMHKSHTPNKGVPGILNAKLLTQAVNMRMNPGLLVQAAAARVKISNELKNEQLSRLELQKETLKHMQERNAQQIIVVDGPRTRAQEENDNRAKFMARSNIKDNIVAQNQEETEMSLQPNKFNVLGWEYKKISDIKLRSNLVADHLNGKYCPREIPKKDQERYRPSRIFKTMYQKSHTGVGENSRNNEDQGKHLTEQYKADMYSTQKKAIKQNVADLIYRSQNGDPDREQMSPYPKNDYAPPFVSSLNFNFNMNDVFGSTKKQPTLKSIQSSGLQIDNTKSVQEMLGTIKNSMEQRRNSINQNIAAKSATRQQTNGKYIKTYETLPAYPLQTGSSSTLNMYSSPLRLSGQLNTAGQLDEGQDQTAHQLRRKLHNHVLKNQYSYWAGMLVKKMPNNQSEGDSKQEGFSNSIVSDSRNLGGAEHHTMPIVDFGDPRSLTQGISFKRKRGPYMPEQEMKVGGTVSPLPPPFLRGLMPPRIPAKKKK